MSPESAVLFDPLKETPSFAVEKILKAGNRGPCGGVWRMFKIMEIAIDENANREPIWVNWLPVNNIPVTETYQKQGIKVFMNNWDLVPDRSLVASSAHGVGPDFFEKARQKECTVVADGTCQLVTRVQLLVRKAAREGKRIGYIGVTGHPETIGVMAQVAANQISLIESRSRMEYYVGSIPDILFSQTTLSTLEVADKYKWFKEKYPQIEIPPRWDICNATDTRQSAVRELIKKVQLLVVVGSGPSHNSNELRNIADELQIPGYLIDRPIEVDEQWFTNRVKSVGVTSGASVPDYLMGSVVDRISELNPGATISEEEKVVDEDLDQVFKYQEKEIREKIANHYRMKYAS